VFLCLRCHTGHNRQTDGHPQVTNAVNLDQNPNMRQVFYTNCTECHTQIHGSDVPSSSTPNAASLMR
jgi:hypothetical protein